ncbi:hypothetical protein LJR267_009445 [Paraburkholderia hospita]|uniref:hypothetical protein n=1 Tax=Paraburkholderia hospita TaxID=169430 RepID=UPI003ECD4FC2
MLDRLFRKFGYAPMSSMNLMPADAALPSDRPAPHRSSAEQFDFDRATRDSVSFWYSNEDEFRHAVGRDDWAPLAVVGLSLMGSRRCLQWLDEGLRASLWVTHDVLESWHTSNHSVLHRIGERLDDRISFPAYLIPATGNEEQDVVPFINAPEMAEVFSMTWHRAQLASPFVFLSSSDPYVTLNNHHVLRSVHQTNEHARERVLSWLTIWLEARGLTVDRKQQLVHLPGYQALFYQSSPAY